jgi:hypothetical protein
LHQRRSRNRKKQSQEPEQFGSSERKKQNVHGVQPHFFAEHAGHEDVQFNLIDQEL